MKKYKFEQVIIPEFIFTDGSVGTFVGFNRGCYPCDGVEYPKWIWQMGLFDAEGNYFKIKIDERKSKLRKKVTFICDGTAYYHPITKFYTIGGKINPENGHCLPHIGCEECSFHPSNINQETFH